MKITKDTLKDIELWLHPKQKDGYIEGNDLYAHLKENNLLESCLKLEDLEEIQKLGIDEFRKYFTGKWIYAWGTVRHRDGLLRVPCLYDVGDMVVLDWYWLDNDWIACNPALRVASTSSSTPQTSSPQSLSSLPSLESAIKVCKEAGYVIYKPI